MSNYITFHLIQSIEPRCYLVDEKTLVDLVAALTAGGLDLTASQAAKLSYIKNILELENNEADAT